MATLTTINGEIKELCNFPLEPELIAEIDSSSKIMIVERDELFVKEGDQMDMIPLLLKGTVRCFYKDYDLDREILYYYAQPGESCLFTYFSMFDDHKSKVFAVAEKRTKILMVPREQVMEWHTKYKSWNKFMVNSYIKRYMDLLDGLKKAGLSKIEDRVIDYLDKKSDRVRSKSIKTTHKFIANDLGTTREVISRTLHHLENKNYLIRERGKILLKN
ncbi:MAG: Crp/Fnr family transcriptional regulator [Candidatus Marinimicrobia bacterium]|nr:Crp/Fnr family transcriptional regulator [Candidatus Neomarinimicrobiota bacterium]